MMEKHIIRNAGSGILCDMSRNTTHAQAAKTIVTRLTKTFSIRYGITLQSAGAI